MFCRKCGKEMNDSDMFCPACGTPVIEGDGGIFPPTEENALPMKWYKFLIYFSLFAGAILSVISAFNGIASIKNYPDVYELYPFLAELEIGYAVCNVLYAALAIYTRFALAGYKKIGPFCLYVCYGFSALAALLYSVVGYLLTEGIYNNTTVIFSTLTSIITIAANYIYFTKRKHLFVK